jgi:hypothetical protein
MLAWNDPRKAGGRHAQLPYGTFVPFARFRWKLRQIEYRLASCYSRGGKFCWSSESSIHS